MTVTFDSDRQDWTKRTFVRSSSLVFPDCNELDDKWRDGCRPSQRLSGARKAQSTPPRLDWLEIETPRQCRLTFRSRCIVLFHGMTPPSYASFVQKRHLHICMEKKLYFHDNLVTCRPILMILQSGSERSTVTKLICSIKSLFIQKQKLLKVFPSATWTPLYGEVFAIIDVVS